MNTYYTKCGRWFTKSTTAETTGCHIEGDEFGAYEDKCSECPFIIDVKEGYGEDAKHKRWECRAGSKEPNHKNDWIGGLDDKNTISIRSLDHEFCESVIAFAKDHPELGASYTQDGADCRKHISVSCSSNKKGIAAKKELIDKFFPSQEAAQDPEPETKKICGNCANYFAKDQDISGCFITHDAVSRYRPAENCGDFAPDNKENDLSEDFYFCTQDDCPFNDRACGCQFDGGNPSDEEYAADVAKAVDEYDCDNKEVLSAHRFITGEDPEESLTESQPPVTGDANEGSKTMIQNINISKIHSHPDNPRKDLGDLTELAESIKAQGILQNLTVVPWIGEVTGEPIEGLYKAVIGHRRLAAAKLAGLTEVPCVISDMDHKQQVATMLLENMQRSDLTVYEQAQGFQMMMDLGESVSGISGKTGLSETTIHRRVKLLELDQDKFKKSVEQGATLMDFAELEKIKNLDIRNDVLQKFGTSNFKWELQKAIDKEKDDKEMALLIEQLKTFAEEIDNNSGKCWIRSYYPRDSKDFQKPKDADTAKYYYVVSQYGGVTLYGDPMPTQTPTVNTSAPAVASNNKEYEQRQRVKAALDEIAARAYQLRHDFIFGLSNAEAKKHWEVINEYAIKVILDECYGFDYDEFATTFDIKAEDEDADWEFKNFTDMIRNQPARCLLITAYSSLDSKNESYYDWYNNHKQNEDLDLIYEFLERLGYASSDEENQMRGGSHELFDKPKETPKADPIDPKAKEGLHSCEAESYPFYAYDTEGPDGCGFDQEDENDENFFRDMQEAILDHMCQNPVVKAKYDKLFEETGEEESTDEND